MWWSAVDRFLIGDLALAIIRDLGPGRGHLEQFVANLRRRRLGGEPAAILRVLSVLGDSEHEASSGSASAPHSPGH
jgi:hypothetical protein